MFYLFEKQDSAVVYGDMIQMLILFGGIIICLVYALDYLGGWSSFTEMVDRNRLLAVDFNSFGFNPDESFGFWPMVLGGFFLYASYYGTDQSQVQRLLAANSLGTVRKTILYNGILRFPVTLSYCVMGLVLGTFAMSQPEFITQIPVDKPDLMIPIFIRDYLPHGIIGLLIVAILSAAMSSLSSAVNSLSAVTTEDFIAHGKNLTHDQYLKYSRWTSLIWGTLCVILAFYTGNIASTVIEAINKIGSVFYGPILATFLAAIQIKKIKARGINVGIVMGVGVNVYFWLVVGDQVFWFWWNLIGAVVTLSTGYLVSLLLPDNSKQASTLSFEKESLFSKDTVLLLFYFALIIITSILIPHLI